MEIVPATVDDADLCLNIQRTAEVAALQHIFPKERYSFPNEEIRTAWLTVLTDPGVEVHLAIDAGEVVGAVSLGRGYLRTLYVMPAVWGQGIGGLLHDFALDRLRTEGAEDVRLWTLADNHRACLFYEKRGWMITGATRVVPWPPHPIEVEYARSTCREPPSLAAEPRRRGES